jgi:hypothetical protein
MAANGYALLRSRRTAEREEPVHSFYCPGCKRKLRYRQRQIGHPGMCPRCKQKFTFPQVALKK